MSSATGMAAQVASGKVLSYLKHLFECHAGPDGKWTPKQTQIFIKSIQGQYEDPRLVSSIGLDEFLAYMTSPASSIVLPAKEQDMSWPLASYYISSSHNTYLSGNQLSSDSTVDAYTNVLRRGCRCVEVDVWDGDETDSESSDSDADVSSDVGDEEKKSGWNDTLGRLKSKLKQRSVEVEQKPPPITEPRVLHGYTLTKDISFRDVCVAIRDSAFVTTSLPLIVSLEVHCCVEQQAVMVDIMRETWGALLVQEPEKEDAVAQLPSPDQLRNKILVKVKYSPPSEAGLEKIESGGSETSPPADAAKQQERRKASKMAPVLSKLGVYLRGTSFKAWSQPEASLATHIFSLSEKKLLDHHESQWADLFDHNKSFLLRTYPSGLRIRSSNLNPAFFWGSGAQIVALNWQETDRGMMLNEGMFAGTGGFVLKPEGYLPNIASRKTSTDVVVRKMLSLALTFLAAQSVPLPPREKSAKGFKPYVKVELHVEASGAARGEDGEEYKARTKTHRGCDFDLEAEKVEFNNVGGLIEELTFVRFTVRDEEFGKDDLAAWACVRLDRLGEGYRFVRLMDGEGAATDGIVLVKVEKRLVDAPQP